MSSFGAAMHLKSHQGRRIGWYQCARFLAGAFGYSEVYSRSDRAGRLTAMLSQRLA